MTYAEILLSRNTDRLFTYQVPESLTNKIKVGSNVVVPFRNIVLSGFVVRFVSKPDFKLIKNVMKVNDQPCLFTENSIKIAEQISEYYMVDFLKSLYLFLPPGMDKKNKKINQLTERIVSFAISPDQVYIAKKELSESKRNVKMLEVIDLVKKNGGIYHTSKISAKSSLASLVKKGILKIEDVVTSRDVVQNKSIHIKSNDNIKLNEHQQKAIDDFKSCDNKFFLLHGITGSGKTEVYMEMIADTLKKGKKSVVLVPEISLTPQTVSRFYNRFGDRVAVLHSSLSISERKSEWYRILREEADIIIGPRSALFAPIKKLGLIIIDESHDSSYKQDNNPRYSAVSVAGWISRISGASVVLGSATPLIERYYNAKKDRIKLLSLPEKAVATVEPEIELVDMQKEQQRGNYSLFSSSLVKKINETLDRKEQVILLLNRRGYSPYIICKDCGEKLKCPSCDVALTKHNDDKLYCHYCGFTRSSVPACPKCTSTSFKQVGAGTQKIENELAQYFPKAGILRMDRDSTAKTGSMEAIISNFAKGEADILIGTQMVAKGHDFPNVSLVGVVMADIALNMPDFRSSERVFSMLMQVSGRGGRRGQQGNVVIQTYEPEHYSIASVKEHSYVKFYEQEIDFRKELLYPPFKRIARVLLKSISEQRLIDTQTRVDNNFSAEDYPDVEFFGPFPAPLYKVSDSYRFHLIIKSENIHKIHLVVKSLLKIVSDSKVNISVDVEPFNFM